jgi:hypothetical protein
MTPHREWFFLYEKYNGGEVFLGDELIARIIGHLRVRFLLKDGRIRKLPKVLQIP